MADDEQRSSEQPEDEQRASEGGELSEVDAMGKDKRRPVVGGQYGATVRKQVTVYGIAVAVIVGLAILSLTVVRNIDNAEIALEDTAPWTEASATQNTPRPIDFPCNGPLDTIPKDEINKAIAPTESDLRSGCGQSSP